VNCRGQGQRKFLMRGQRGKTAVPEGLKRAIAQMQILLKQIPKAKSLESLLGQWEVQADFEVRGAQVWLSEAGRRKLVRLYERRKEERWKHPVTGYSLTYRRLLELEVRLLEKEWMGEGGLFGQLVLR